MPLERGGHDRPRCLGPPVVDRLDGRVEHERDPGQVLDRAVVEEEREPAPLILLGGDDPLDEPFAVLVGYVRQRQSMIASRSADRDRVRARVGLQLREDVPDVALDRLLADEQPAGDIGVRHPVGEQLQDLALARREHVVLLLAGQERRHQGGVDEALAARDLLDRAQQRGVRGLLEDVALRTRLEPAAEEGGSL